MLSLQVKMVNCTNLLVVQVAMTIREIFNRRRPHPDTLGLSHLCLVKLGILLRTSPEQGDWRDVAKRFGGQTFLITSG